MSAVKRYWACSADHQHQSLSHFRSLCFYNRKQSKCCFTVFKSTPKRGSLACTDWEVLCRIASPAPAPNAACFLFPGGIFLGRWGLLKSIAQITNADTNPPAQLFPQPKLCHQRMAALKNHHKSGSQSPTGQKQGWKLVGKPWACSTTEKATKISVRKVRGNRRKAESGLAVQTAPTKEGNHWSRGAGDNCSH